MMRSATRLASVILAAWVGQTVTPVAHAQAAAAAPRLNVTGTWDGSFMGGSTLRLAQDGDRVFGLFDFGNGKGVARGTWKGGSLILILTPTETQSGNACDPRKLLVVSARGSVAHLDPYVLDLATNAPYSSGMTRSSPTAGPIPAYPYADELKNCGQLFTYELAFETNSDKLIGDEWPILQALADLMKSDPKLKIQVTGHTDSTGNAAANQALSQRRAGSVMRVLVERYHADAGRLSAKGYGPDQPMAENDTEQGRAINRRVELIRE